MINRNPDIEDMVRYYLKKFGYEGLYNDECGCDIDDLMPCAGPGQPEPTCKAGYRCRRVNKDVVTGKKVKGCAHGCIVATKNKDIKCCNDSSD